jgi:hypothetical protein
MRTWSRRVPCGREDAKVTNDDLVDEVKPHLEDRLQTHWDGEPQNFFGGAMFLHSSEAAPQTNEL